MGALFSKPKPPTPPPPPPSSPTQADTLAPTEAPATQGYSSMISTGSQGLTRKAKTAKSSLIGGS